VTRFGLEWLDCWRETDNFWRTTVGLTAAFGGRPLRGGSAA